MRPLRTLKIPCVPSHPLVPTERSQAGSSRLMGIMLIGFMLMTTGIPTSTALAQQPAAPTEAPQAAPPEQLATFFQLSLGTVTEEELAHQIVGNNSTSAAAIKAKTSTSTRKATPSAIPPKALSPLAASRSRKSRSQEKSRTRGRSLRHPLPRCPPWRRLPKDAESIRVTPKKENAPHHHRPRIDRKGQSPQANQEIQEESAYGCNDTLPDTGSHTSSGPSTCRLLRDRRRHHRAACCRTAIPRQRRANHYLFERHRSSLDPQKQGRPSEPTPSPSPLRCSRTP